MGARSPTPSAGSPADDVAIEQPTARLSANKAAAPANGRRRAGAAALPSSLPEYPDADALARVERRLAGSELLVEIADDHPSARRTRRASRRRRPSSSRAATAPRASPSSTPTRCASPTICCCAWARCLRAASGATWCISRASPASSPSRARPARRRSAGTTLPSYRGDAINGPAFTAAAARPIRSGCLTRTARRRSRSSCSRPTQSASYADLPKVHRDVGPRSNRRGRSRCSPATRRCCSITSRR